MGSKKKKMKVQSTCLMPCRETTTTTTTPIPAEKSSTTIGCMSGIFHFLSRHHHNSRKRLPSARKEAISSDPPKETPQPLPVRRTSLPKRSEGTMQLNITDSIIPEKTFCVKEIRRSPTLPSEIRRKSSSVELMSLDSPRRPTSVVVKLMGLDDVPMTSPKSTADQKRRKLLGALDKCDEDLKSLKRIIEEIRVSNRKQNGEIKINTGKVQMENGCDSSIETINSLDSAAAAANGEQPSPVSVLQAISSPKYFSKGSETEKRKGCRITTIQLRAQEHSYVSGTNHDRNKQEPYKGNYPSIFHQTTIERLPRIPKRNESELLEEFSRAKRVTDEHSGQHRRLWKWKRSDALVESVGEIWDDGAWEQRRESGRVAVGVERGILGDLVDEFVKELSLGCYYLKALVHSQGTCRKRLCF